MHHGGIELLTRDGVGYMPLDQDGAGLQEHLLASLIARPAGAEWRAKVALLRGRQLEIEPAGTERVAGVEGRVYRLRLAEGALRSPDYEVVISTDPRLAPAGRETAAPLRQPARAAARRNRHGAAALCRVPRPARPGHADPARPKLPVARGAQRGRAGPSVRAAGAGAGPRAFHCPSRTRKGVRPGGGGKRSGRKRDLARRGSRQLFARAMQSILADVLAAAAPHRPAARSPTTSRRSPASIRTSSASPSPTRRGRCTAPAIATSPSRSSRSPRCSCSRSRSRRRARSSGSGSGASLRAARSTRSSSSRPRRAFRATR